MARKKKVVEESFELDGQIAVENYTKDDIKEMMEQKKYFTDILTDELKKEMKGYNYISLKSNDYCDVKVQLYLPILEKKTIVETTLLNAFDTDGNLDHFALEVISSVLIVKFYTNIKLLDDVYESYDMLEQSGILKDILDTIPYLESQRLHDLLDDTIKERRKQFRDGKNVLVSISNFINDTKDKLPEIIDTIKTFDPSKFDMIKKVMDFNNTQGK